MRRTLPLLAGSAVALAVAAGCGGGGEVAPKSDDQALVRATLMRFADATGRRDYGELCRNVLAPSLLQNLGPVNLPCEQATARFLAPVRAPKVAVDRVQVNPGRQSALAFVHTSAMGQPPTPDVVQLVKIDGHWRISRLGAAPPPPPSTTPTPKPPPPGTPND